MKRKVKAWLWLFNELPQDCVFHHNKPDHFPNGYPRGWNCIPCVITYDEPPKRRARKKD